MTWQQIKDEIDRQIIEKNIPDDIDVDYIDLSGDFLGEYEIIVSFDANSKWVSITG